MLFEHGLLVAGSRENPDGGRFGFRVDDGRVVSCSDSRNQRFSNALKERL